MELLLIITKINLTTQEIRLLTLVKNWYLSTLFRSFLKSQCILPLRLRRRDSLRQRTFLLVEDITHLLSFCLKTAQLAYNGPYHQQVSGTAMGSPVSDVITNIVMEDVEQRALADFTG